MIQCKICEKDMILDDVDIHYEGTRDNYYVCENCYISCTEIVRNNTTIDLIWIEE